MDGIKSRAAKFGGIEASQAHGDLHIGGHPVELRCICVAELFGFGELCGGKSSEVFEPLRNFDWRILGAALALKQLGGEVIDSRKELRIEWADVAEDFR